MSKQANNILVKQFKVNTQHTTRNTSTAATPSLIPTAINTAHLRVRRSMFAELLSRTS